MKVDDSILQHETVLLSGMGRSGTTWCGEIINYDRNYRIIFEPFLPTRVPEAEPFKYLQYLRPDQHNPVLEGAAKAILAGDVNDSWSNKFNGKAQGDDLLIKDIRTNLMLGWLRRLNSQLKIVLMVRHPLQVAHSWVRLGWKKEAFGKRTNLEAITQQASLLNDFPVIKDVAGTIDGDDLFQDVIFQWCLYHLVPVCQLSRSDAFIIFYEDLMLKPRDTIQQLFQFLGRDFDWNALEKLWASPSGTNYLKRDYSIQSPESLTGGWKSFFTPAQIDFAFKMLDRFGLSTIYNDAGLPSGSPLRTHKNVSTPGFGKENMVR